VDKEEESRPVEAEHDEVMASSTDGLPFRNSLRTGGERRGLMLPSCALGIMGKICS